jgi:hypothetical protein
MVPALHSILSVPFSTAETHEGAPGETYALKGTYMKYLRLDLKVCEGCGALWLRGANASGIYCRGCAARLAEFPAPRGRHAGGRKRRQAGAARCNGAIEVRGGAR